MSFYYGRIRKLASNNQTFPSGVKPFQDETSDCFSTKKAFQNNLRYKNHKSNSPGIALMPQSMTTAPGLIQAPFTISGRPIPTTKMSARRV